MSAIPAWCQNSPSWMLLLRTGQSPRQYGAFRCRRDMIRVELEIAARDTRRGRDVGRTAPVELRRFDQQIEVALGQVDRDPVAVLDQADDAAARPATESGLCGGAGTGQRSPGSDTRREDRKS